MEVHVDVNVRSPSLDRILAWSEICRQRSALLTRLFFHLQNLLGYSWNDTSRKVVVSMHLEINEGNLSLGLFGSSILFLQIVENRLLLSTTRPKGSAIRQNAAWLIRLPLHFHPGKLYYRNYWYRGEITASEPIHFIWTKSRGQGTIMRPPNPPGSPTCPEVDMRYRNTYLTADPIYIASSIHLLF